MILLEIIFWLALFLVFYAFIGYGLVAFVLVKLKGKRPPLAPLPGSEWPEVTLVIPAYNEMDCLPAKLQNSFSLDYPENKRTILVVAEGSTDGSQDYLRQLTGIQYIGGTARRGKIEAINMAMQQIKTPVVVFTDANTTLNPAALKNLVRHFADPKVAAVAGEKRIITTEQEQATGAGEGIYWKYESFLKKLDSELNTIVGAAGELFSLRTHLYAPVEPDTLLDDFMISMRLAAQGYRVVYEPEAYAMEKPSYSMAEEKKRKVRISTGGYQSMRRLLPLLNPFRYGLLSFQYISHRVLRWAVTPFCLPFLFLLNILLLPGHTVYAFIFAGQLLFYSLALTGFVLERYHLKVKAFFIPYYFCFMHYALLVGFKKYLTGTQSGIWEKAKRA